MVKIAGFKKSMSVSDMFFLLAKLLTSKKHSLEFGWEDEEDIDCVLTDRFYYTRFQINILKSHLQALLAVLPDLFVNKNKTTEAVMTLRDKLADIEYLLGNSGINDFNKISNGKAILNDSSEGRVFMSLIEKINQMKRFIKDVNESQIEYISENPTEKAKIKTSIEETAQKYEIRAEKALILLEKLEEYDNKFDEIGNLEEEINEIMNDTEFFDLPFDCDEIQTTYDIKLIEKAEEFGITRAELLKHGCLSGSNLCSSIFDFRNHQKLYLDVVSILELEEGVVKMADKISEYGLEALTKFSTIKTKKSKNEIVKQLGPQTSFNILSDVIRYKKLMETYQQRIRKYNLINDKTIFYPCARIWFYEMISSFFFKEFKLIMKVEKIDFDLPNKKYHDFTFDFNINNHQNKNLAFINNILASDIQYIAGYFDIRGVDYTNIELGGIYNDFHTFMSDLRTDYKELDLETDSDMEEFHAGVNNDFFTDYMVDSHILNGEPEPDEEPDVDEEEEEDEDDDDDEEDDE